MGKGEPESVRPSLHLDLKGNQVAHKGAVALAALKDTPNLTSLDLDLKDNETLRIFFAVPEVRYADFVTNMVNPLLDEPELRNVRIFHVSIGGDK